VERSTRRGQPQTISAERLKQLLDHLRAAWQRADDVDLLNLLPPPGDPLRHAALTELIKADLQIRWQRKQGKPLESYVERIPELGDLTHLSPEMIYEEYRARLQHGQAPSLSSYRERFPKQYDELERLVHDQPTGGKLEETHVFNPVSVPKPALVPSFNSPLPGATPKSFEAVGGYKLLKRLGRGSFAEVWQGEGPGGFPVAIKRVLQPIEDEDAQRELQSLEQIKELRHLFLLQTHAYFLIENHLFVVMELADGTLRDRAKECRQQGKNSIPLDELFRYFTESAEALDYMHSKRLLHRDIKPQNILFTNGHAKVADFGLALLGGSKRALFSATGSGTPAYMAPEVWKGKVGPASDQYGLALTYAEQRLGRLPYKSTDIHSLMMDHMNSVPDLAGLPEAEQKVLTKALAKNPEERYESCKAFMESIEGSLAGQLQRSSLSMRAPGPDTVEMFNSSATGPGGRGSQDWRGDATALMTVQAQVRRALWLKVVPVVLVVAVLAGLGFVAWQRFRPFTITATPLVLAAGEAKELEFRLHRPSADRPTEVEFEEPLPSWCQVRGVKVREGQDRAAVTFMVAPGAPEGSIQLRVQARNGESTAKVVLDVAIGPPLYALPSTWEPASNAQLVEVDGKAYYNRIDVTKAKLRVPFLLIHQPKRDDEPAFYIMEDKVWVGLFRDFTVRDKENQQDWHDCWMRLKAKGRNEDDDWPVLGVRAEEADAFASWMGGRLPSQREWDMAAGRPSGRDPVGGPFDPTADLKKDLSINMNVPVKRGKLDKDKSPTGCRHMAGNGAEWTDDLDGQTPPLSYRQQRIKKELPPLPHLLLRGQPHSKEEPLLYKDIGNIERTLLAYPIDKDVPAHPEIGFRVVLDLPGPVRPRE